VIRGALALALGAALALTSCKRPDDGTRPVSRDLPKLTLTESTPNLLLTWIDAKGEFHTAMTVAAVPPEGRDAVRVVVTTSDDGATTEQVYVANLRERDPTGAFKVTTMTRAEWEGLAERRRGGAPGLPPRASGDAPPPPPVADTSKVSATVYGAEWCKPCHAAQAYLTRRRVQVVYKDIEQDRDAQREMSRKLARAGLAGGQIPVIDVGGQLLVGFDPAAIDAALAKAPGAGVAL